MNKKLQKYDLDKKMKTKIQKLKYLISIIFNLKKKLLIFQKLIKMIKMFYEYF